MVRFFHPSVLLYFLSLSLTFSLLLAIGLLSGETMGMLAKLPLEKVVVTNTICQTEHLKQSGGRNGKLEIMDISPVLAESIRRVSTFSTLFTIFSFLFDC